MRKLIGIAAMVLIATVPAFGVGTAAFDPPIREVIAGQPASFEITIMSGVGDFDAADLIIGTDHTVGFTSFVYADTGATAWRNLFSNVNPDPADIFNDFNALGYKHLVSAGGANSAGSVGDQAILGTVTLDTTGMPLGDYPVQINSAIDGFSSLGLAGQSEDVAGMGTIRIVPEPASLMLLGIGAVAGLRRRRA